MSKQNFELINDEIKNRFIKLKKNNPEKLTPRLNFSWSNWGFGMESLEDSLNRLKRAGINYIELHGNHYSDDLGYNLNDTLNLLNKYEIKVSGICGMFSDENDLSSNSHLSRQAAIDYVKREVDFVKKVGGHYLLVVPGAVGRPNAYDNTEFIRSAETLKKLGDLFVDNNIKAAIEPVRADEVSLVHNVHEAKRYINTVNHKGI